jgi:YARHG domain
MKIAVSIAVLGMAVSTLTVTAASAESCADLWYQRNQIYADNGYCFKTQLGLDSFGNDGCFTRNPKFTRAEQREIAAIKKEEKRRGCKVN